MYSAYGSCCSQQVGSPIRTSPDHWLLAPSRGFSQLATSFFACLRQGIHTHALSSLTIKLTPLTHYFVSLKKYSSVTCYYPSDILLSKIRCMKAYSAFSECSRYIKRRALAEGCVQVYCNYWWAWVESNYRPHPYQGCALTT